MNSYSEMTDDEYGSMSSMTDGDIVRPQEPDWLLPEGENGEAAPSPIQAFDGLTKAIKELNLK